jgi:hypothetical protein
MRRFGVLVLAAVVTPAVIASSAQAALFFLFKPTTATPGELVTVRLGGTPPGFNPEQRVKPFRPPIRVYLVPNRVAAKVSSRLDPRLHFIGRIVPDRNSRGVLTFSVPPLDTDSYAAAAWCPGCARYSFGRTFSALPVVPGGIGRFRHLQLLGVAMPPATTTCPVTIPNSTGPPPGLAANASWHTNGFLWTRLPLNGVLVPDPGNVGWPGDPEGSIGTKLFWFAAHQDGELTLRGQRLDSLSPQLLIVRRVNRGTSTGFRGTGTWATPVTFPSEGCWRLTARVADVSLSFVLKVVRS